jgi:DNA-binding beta-propeller fold protein YncE
MTKKRMITQAGSAILLIALVSLLAACGAAPAAPTAAPTATPAPTQPPPPPTATTAPAAAEPASVILEPVRTFDLDIKPHDIAIDGDGNLYAVDLQNAQIVKYDRDGQRLAAWGERGSEAGQFEFLPPPDGPPLDGGFVTVDADGNVYVSDSFNNRVQKFDSEGKHLAMWSNLGAEDAVLNVPGPISVDALGRLYVADFSGVQQYDLDGAFVASRAAAGEAAVDSQGNLFMPLAFQNIVFKMDGNGEAVGQWGGQGRGDGQFDFPMLLVVDSQDRIYVSDQSGRIQRFDASGAFQGKWFPESESGQPAALLLAMTIDGEDNLYVAAKDRTTVYVLREP